jgi:signal transduction histidine kinase
MVLHELRAPLGLMVSAARAAAEECGDGTSARRHVEVIERTALRLLASAQQVLYAAIAERHQNDEPFDPFAVARDWLSDSVSLGQRIHAVVDGEAGWFAQRGNAGQFVALLQSILSNALDHGTKTEPIEIHLEARSSHLSVSVTNCVGTQRHRGLGFGADVCQRLGDALDAEIRAKSVAGWYTSRVTLRPLSQLGIPNTHAAIAVRA